jgi:transposase
MIAYKSLKNGKIAKKIGRFEASTQICHCCGHRQKMPLNVRTYECIECGMKIDRDLNAAINIRNFALRDLMKNTDGTSEINACGVGSSGNCGANCSCKTADNEARKSSECSRSMEEHLKITPFKV